MEFLKRLLAFFGISTSAQAKQRLLDAGKAALETAIRKWFGGLSPIEQANLTAGAVEDSLHAVIAALPITTTAKAQSEVVLTKTVSGLGVGRDTLLSARNLIDLEAEIIAALKGAKVK